MRAKITKRAVDAMRPSDRDVFIWDTEVKGFGLKVTPKGRRVYLVQTRFQEKLRRYTIGVHGSPWSPDMARDEVTRLLGMIASGIDPSEQKKEQKRDITVAALCDIYLAEGCTKKKPSTIAVETGLLKRHVKPLLGRKRVKSIGRSDVERFMSDVADGKTAIDLRTGKRGRAIVRGGKGTANRTIDLLASMLTFAVHRDMMSENPARGVERYRQGHRERFLSPIELTSLGDVLAQAEAEFHDAEERRLAGHKNKSGRSGVSDYPAGEDPLAIAAIRLLLLTGCRKSEILALKWDWIDFDRCLLRLPDSKTGAKVVPLGAPALKIFDGVRRIEGNPHVFPSASGEGHFVGLQKVWSRLRSRAGRDDVRLHDLRHSFASVGASGGDSLYIVGKLLGHSQSRTTQRYAHLSDDPVRTAAERISGQIAAAMEGRSGEVVDLTKRKN